jgi:hypothetical protein
MERSFFNIIKLTVMPKFNVKDLMVSLAANQDRNVLCLNFSGCFNLSCLGFTHQCLLACSHLVTHVTCYPRTVVTCLPRTFICPENTVLVCPGGSINCGGSVTPWIDPAIIGEVVQGLDVKELTELRAALQGLVEKVDKEFIPAKKQQLNSLEDNLKDVIKEIKEQKDKI